MDKRKETKEGDEVNAVMPTCTDRSTAVKEQIDEDTIPNLNRLSSEQQQSPEGSDVRDRIRINKQKLDHLLNQDPLGDASEGIEEETDLPFHSGPRRLSIFREPSPPPTPKAVNLTDRYEAAFQSFLKHRPLSESFSNNFTSYDFSSSSDEDVSEPLPESPLNLSDTESVMSGQNSPRIFSRRHNKLFSSSQSNTADNRPKSLYDSAKPRPPKEQQKSEREKVSEKLHKLMQLRKKAKTNKDEEHFQNSYQKSYEPVPPNVTWTNVVAHSHGIKLRPHPPATSPTNAIPNPKKKRHAPKPPPNVAPYSETTTSSPSVVQPIIGKSDLLNTTNSSGGSVTNVIEPTRRTEDESTACKELTPPSGGGAITSNFIQSDSGQGDNMKMVTRQLSQSKENTSNSSDQGTGDKLGQQSLTGDASSNVDSDSGLCGSNTPISEDILNPNESSIANDALVSLEKQKLVVEEILQETKTTDLTHNSPLCVLRKDHQEKAFETCPKPSEGTFSRSSEANLQVTDYVISLIVDDLLSAVEDEISTDNKRLNSNVSRHNSKSETHSSADICRTSDVTNRVGLQHDRGFGTNDTKSSRRPKVHKHRISMDNASSGYSSPGSGDEAPLSPETPISPLTIPSPTSSYYSASLSASSSRVSDLSRELTLPKTTAIDENEVTAFADTRSLERQLVTHNVCSNSTASVSCTSSISEPLTAAGETENIVMGSPDSTKESDVFLVTEYEETLKERDSLSDIPIKFRNKSATKVRSKSEYIPYRSDQAEISEDTSRVSICMVEKPTETGSLSRAQAKLYHQKGSRKKALAAGQKSRAFAMRAKLHWPRQRHSYAESNGTYILEENDPHHPAPSSNLVSHFVSTQDISTYYDGTEYRTMTADEILHSKRDEIFNAYKHAPVGGNSEIIGGSVRHLPVSTKEFGFMNDIIQEELDSTEQSGKNDPNVDEGNRKSVVEASKPVSNTENPVQRQPSEASSSSSGTRYSQASSAFNDSTWSLGGDLSNQARQRKPSLRRRIQSAFSFQNIRKAMSMEKLNEEEKHRSMSHHYLDANGSQYTETRERSATLQGVTISGNNTSNHEPLRKAPSISSLISSVRMRKRRSRMKADQRNRHTIADPESFAKDSENANQKKRFQHRPTSAVLSNTSRRKLEDVGSPSFFRPIGRVLQMNPGEGTLLVEMVKPSSGPFGFYIARKKGSGDFGSVFISRLSDSYPDKMFAGLMRTGDEITEINGTTVSGLTLDQVYDLILDSEKTLLKLKPAQVHIV